MDATTALRVLLDAHRLKHVPRTGWVMRGVACAESVADHSYGVIFVSLVLAEMVEQPLDRGKLLTIALLHDLPESVISDLPTPATVHFPPGAKQRAEAKVLSALLRDVPDAGRWRAWWQEFEDGTSAEGRLVRDADRLDMLIQAYVYEQTTGNRWLEEFWPSPGESSFEFPAAQAVYGALAALRRRPEPRSQDPSDVGSRVERDAA
jgi:putative hydrolase of HD superfamily